MRSPWGQDIIVSKLTNYVSSKTHSIVSIKKLFITFSGDIDLQGLYLEDQKGDTLIYSEELQVDIPLLPIILGNSISIDNIEWTGLQANILRRDSVEGFNYQFLIDAFGSDSTDVQNSSTNSELPEISIGLINLSNFKINFEDDVSGTFANLNLGAFSFEGKDFDLNKLKFQVAEMSLEDTEFSYLQTKPSITSDSTETALPFLGLDNLKLKNVIVQYESLPDSIDAKLNLAYVELQMPKADLANQDVEIGQFVLNNSSITVKVNSKNDAPITEIPGQAKPDDVMSFIWPNWNIGIKSIALQNNLLHYQVGAKPKEIKSFNPNFIVLTNFNFKAKDIAFTKNKSAKLQLEKFSFYEGSGLALSQLTFSSALDSTQFSVENLLIKAGNSMINTDFKVQFASIQSIIEKPEDLFMTLDLKQFVLDVNDVLRIQPELSQNEYIKKLAIHKLTGQAKAEGTLTKLNLNNLLINWGQNTSLRTNGEFMNLAEFNKFFADIDNFTFYSTRSDLGKFVSETDLGITIPERVLLQTQFKGKLDDFQTRTKLNIPEGKINVEGQFRQHNGLAFAAKLNVIDFNLGKIINNPQIGVITFGLDASGDGQTVNDLNAKLTSDFSKLEFSGYDYSALQLDGELNEGKGGISLNYMDRNLDLVVNSKIELDSISPKISLDFNLVGADLYALGLTEEQIKAKLLLNASFEGNFDEFNFNFHVSEGLAVFEEKPYSLGTVDLITSVANDSTSADIKSDFLNGKLRANAGIDRISSAILQQLESYFTDSTVAFDSIGNPVMLQMNMKLSETKLVTEFLLPEMITMDTLSLEVDFNQAKNKLTANFNLPYLDYAKNTLDSLKMEFNLTEKEAKFKFGFNELNAQPLVMERTFFDGDIKDGVLNLNFNAFDGSKEIYVVRTEISGKSSNLTVRLNPEKLLLQGESWSIPADNKINIKAQYIDAQNFVLSRNNQSISIANNLMQTTEANIGIGFANFKLANLLAIFNKDDLLASGDLQGNIVFGNGPGNFGLNSDFSIDNLTALKASLGRLSLNAKSVNSDDYNLNILLKGSDIDLAIRGDYFRQNVGSELDFTFKLNKIGMRTISTLSGESLTDASGNISGELAIQGSMTSSKYQGYLQFNEALFNISQLNSKFHLFDDKIEIDNSIITLKDFSIADDRSNKFTLNGYISTENISDPEFDLSLYGKNFQALNSTKEDNDLFYGSVNFDVDGTIKGKMSFPLVDLNIGINESTNFTYVIPESQAELEKRDGIVEFVNKENPDNILTRTNDSNDITIFGGIELSAKLSIDEGANFNVIVDPKTGDNLNITGVGDLDFNIAKNGRTALSGRYEINDGYYNLSLYNLVKRKFDFESGSSITWHGDPMNADIDVTAKYSLEASASALMASQTSSSSEVVNNKYRQKLPFDVFLNVNGELEQPQLDFRLDMPEDSRGAIDGNVYARIKQINTEVDELNKQVFSLLVLQKFYPNSGSDGSDGGAANLVRKNINDALSDQLNSFSDKLTGNIGIELDFGLNSYTDYQGESAQQRTDLNISAQKKLLEDRLIVQVGSNVNVEGDPNPGEVNPLVGNASIQYLLTKDGQWRLKGFRNSEYENVIDGQVFVNGISLIFQRQFNNLSELFVSPFIEEESTNKSKIKNEIDNKPKSLETDKNDNN